MDFEQRVDYTEDRNVEEKTRRPAQRAERQCIEFTKYWSVAPLLRRFGMDGEQSGGASLGDKVSRGLDADKFDRNWKIVRVAHRPPRFIANVSHSDGSAFVTLGVDVENLVFQCHLTCLQDVR